MKVIITQFDVPPPLPAALVTGIVAQPGGQSGATPLRAKLNVVTNAPTACGVKLQSILGNQQTIFNRSGAPVLAFPLEGTQIEGFGQNVPRTIGDGGVAIFTFDGIQTWLVS